MGIEVAAVFTLLTIAVLSSTVSIALAKDGPVVRRARTARELEKLENDWAAAVETNDPNRIGRFFVEDFLFLGAGGILQDRKRHLEDFESGRLRVDSIKIENSTVGLYGTVAVVRSRCTLQAEYNSQDITGVYQITDMWLRRYGEWRVVTREQTQIPTLALHPETDL